MKHFRNIFVTKKEVTYRVTVFLFSGNGKARIMKEMDFNNRKDAFDFLDNMAEFNNNYIDGFVSIIQ